MLITTVSPDKWQVFAQQFSRQHRGWLVNIETLDSRLLELHPEEAEVQGRVLTRDKVLREVAVEQVEWIRRCRIVAGEGSDRFVCEIRRPIAVQFETAAGGAHQGMRIDDDAGATTLIRFRTPADPHTLNGLAEGEH
ncbi:MAG: hypothetical protein ACOY3P_23055 [Planctomycetota bacterium]